MAALRPTSADTTTLSARSERQFFGATWVDGFPGIPKELVSHILLVACNDLPSLVALQKVCVFSFFITLDCC
jgi:hypothetical protein